MHCLQLLWRPSTARHPEPRLYALLQGQPLLECRPEGQLEPWGQHLKQVCMCETPSCWTQQDVASPVSHVGSAPA